MRLPHRRLIRRDKLLRFSLRAEQLGRKAFGYIGFDAVDGHVGTLPDSSKTGRPLVEFVIPGETVTFENRDSTVHSIVGVGGFFRSKPLDTDDRFSFTFDKPGEYTYFCGLHPFMKGKAIVAQ